MKQHSEEYLKKMEAKIACEALYGPPLKVINHSPEFLAKRAARLSGIVAPVISTPKVFKHTAAFIAKQLSILIANPSKKRPYRLTRPANHKLGKHDMTYGEFRSMRNNQGLRCKICKTHEKNLPSKALFIDHDHKTGKVRDLLCNDCNAMLGFGRDNPKILQKGILYLNRHIKLGNTPAPI